MGRSAQKHPTGSVTSLQIPQPARPDRAGMTSMTSMQQCIINPTPQKMFTTGHMPWVAENPINPTCKHDPRSTMADPSPQVNNGQSSVYHTNAQCLVRGLQCLAQCSVLCAAMQLL
eukprot:CAMPEP_0202873490 /NCGR_PEP_ID=MMETSP1391-20130828/23356_1 /ASSEMBLY_ACC=CAM_ASM_000867 /TAXON_ID=1034604 /ORGANISM="Chlamydomonas leiostraca, Strain SAG 11-49" /LENGTH=115 /DNA_ID=CAMNT_0049554715 /DNA_START=16 /DNA_END=363 /DNA_ORIENTATION=+